MLYKGYEIITSQYIEPTHIVQYKFPKSKKKRLRKKFKKMYTRVEANNVIYKIGNRFVMNPYHYNILLEQINKEKMCYLIKKSVNL